MDDTLETLYRECLENICTPGTIANTVHTAALMSPTETICFFVLILRLADILPCQVGVAYEASFRYIPELPTNKENKGTDNEH
ncbi:MAG: hypothetical protein OEZ39_20230 [Gammaproteobacteria bacterium]|nr:hypothetical protein [Gammaproteobacteria bacterium]